MAPLKRLTTVMNQPAEGNNMQIQHFLHQHVLQKIHMTSDFNCDGCNTDGSGVRYRCSPCEFDMHEKCATSCQRISSHLHPHHHLVLINRPEDSHICHVCNGLTQGLSYACEIRTCEFNVHTLCIQTPPGPTRASLARYNEVSNNNNNGTSNSNNIQPEPVVINHHQQQMQGMTILRSYNGEINSQPMTTVNHQQHQNRDGDTHTLCIQTPGHMTPLAGYNEVNSNSNSNNQHVLINHHQQQQMQGMTMSRTFNSQPVTTVNHPHHQHQQSLPMTGFGGHRAVTVNQQGTPSGGYGGYQGGMNSQPQPMMVNQQRVMNIGTQPPVNVNYHQQGAWIPPAPVVGGGYNIVNNNTHTTHVMINHPPPPLPPPPPPPAQQSVASKVAKLAVNIASISTIGVPLNIDQFF